MDQTWLTDLARPKKKELVENVAWNLVFKQEFIFDGLR